MAREYKVISGDSHLDIQPERWVPHVPEQWRNRAPRTVRLPNGNDGLLLENRAPHTPHTPGAQLTGTGIDYALEELEHCAKVGLKGVALYRFPSGKNYPTAGDDRFWQHALAMKVPITAHTSGGTTKFARDEPLFPQTHGRADGRGDPVSILCRFCGETAVVPIQLALAGVFDRFPELRIYHAETQAGWVPFALFQIDDNYARERFKMERNLGIPPLARQPSDYLRQHTLWGFMNDPVAVLRRNDIGVDRIIWGNDFAHAQGDWPESMEVLDEMMEGVPTAERYQMVAGNVIEFFHLNGAA